MTVRSGPFRGDIVWNVGTGYFGCRDRDGNFCIDMFKDTAALPQLKMVEINIHDEQKHEDQQRKPRPNSTTTATAKTLSQG